MQARSNQGPMAGTTGKNGTLKCRLVGPLVAQPDHRETDQSNANSVPTEVRITE
jgi:hypothetical protein